MSVESLEKERKIKRKRREEKRRKRKRGKERKNTYCHQDHTPRHDRRE